MTSERELRQIHPALTLTAYIVVVIFTIVTLVPLVWLAYSSLKPHADIARDLLALPFSPTVQNYVRAWQLGNLGLYALNSIFYATVATAATVVLALAAGYAFAKIPNPLTVFFYGFVLIGMLITVHSVLVPLFLLETAIGLDNTRLGVLLPYVAFGLPFAIYLATVYIRSISGEIMSAAYVDGADHLQIFWYIIVPMSRPIVTTITIFTFLANWNEFVFVYTLTSDTALRSLPVGINAFVGGRVTDYGMQFAALMIGTIPMLVVYLLFRRRLIQGFADSAVKE